MTTSDLVLLAYILLIVPAMLVGFLFARRRMFVPHHKFTMTTITIVNWLLILFVMLVTYRRDVLPQISQKLSLPGVLVPTVHLIPGLIAQLLATYLVIRMWFEKQLPAWFKVKNIKRYMRATIGLWLLTAALGVLTWAVINKGFLAAPAAAVPAGANVIRMVSGNHFDPPELTITTGTTVKFVNADTKSHTVDADDGSWSSDEVQPGDSFSRTFGQPGDVAFFCEYHGDKGHVGMSGVLHVVGTPVTVPTSAPETGAATVATGAAVPSVATKQASAATSVGTAAATAGTGSAQAIQVVLNDDVFQPKEIAVPAGSIVHFVNNGKHRHTVTADDGSFDSGQIKPGDSFDHTFAKAGDVPLYCQNHGDKGGQGMSMVVHVTAGSAAASAVATSAAVTTAAPTGVPTKAPLATTAAVPSVATKQASAATSVSTAAATASAGAAQAVQVVLNDDVFQPKEITVPAGSIVHFVNNGKHRHTVTADDDSFDSGQLKPGDSFDQTFARAGDVPLYCQNHGDKGGQGMSMVVHVTAASAAASSPVATTAVPPTAASGAALATLAPTSSLLDPKVLAAVDSLVISANDTPNKTAYAVGMAAQMAIIKAQAAAITQALAQARYEDAQAAAEAILNVSEGGPGQDRDTDGKINQPGDTFGLKPYIFAVNETANTLQGLVASTDPLQAGALAIQSTGRSALTDLQALSQQAQALLDAKTLVDARKVGPPLADAAAKLDLDVATIVRTIPVIPGSHLTPAPSGS